MKKAYCIKCALEGCESGKYVNNKACDCAPCTDFDSNCLECDTSGCTKCKQGYYVKNNKCEACPPNGCCDGVKVYTTVPSGYYCDSNILYKCTEKYESACTLCTSTKCTACQSYFYMNNGKCESCVMAGCTKCLNTNYCTECYNNRI